MKCFYHNDMDGRASAFCVHAWVGIHDDIPALRDSFESFSFIPINYNIPFPLETIRKDEQVWIVDYSIPPAEMLKLLEITKDVTWIDHHKTAIEKYTAFPHPIRGVRKDGEAGCVLAWKYIHWWSGRGEGEIDLDRDRSEHYPVPLAIKYIGDRDVWAWEFGDMTKWFYAGAQSHDTSPGSDFWWQCLDHEIDPSGGPGNAKAHREGVEFFEKLLNDGKAIERYRHHFYADYCAELSFPIEIDGHKALSMNVAHVGSEAFGGDEAFKTYDILAPFYFDGKQFTVSLYSKTVDVSEIAKRYGGGGHKGASGFQCDTFPFNKI